MSDPADGKPVAPVAGEIADHRVASAAQDIVRVFETEISDDAVLAREPLASGHKRHAVVAVVDHGVLQQRVKAAVDCTKGEGEVRRQADATYMW